MKIGDQGRGVTTECYVYFHIGMIAAVAASASIAETISFVEKASIAARTEA